MRKRLLTARVGIVMTMLAGLVSAPASAEEYYPMVCRAGGDMYGRIFTDGDAGSPSNGLHINLFFEKASTGYAVSPDALEPGQCAWVDRAIRDSEPRMARFESNSKLSVVFDDMDRDALIFKSRGRGRDYVQLIMRTLMDGDYFWFEAANANASRDNHFMIRNFASGRPATSSA